MKIRFIASEALEMFVEEQSVSIRHYLRQPQHLVRAIANPKLMTQLSEERFQLKMNPLNFLEIYYFQPTVVLRVWSTTKGTVYLKSESCEIKGIEYINQRFSLQVTGILSPQDSNGKTYLKGRADLEIQVELPPPLWFTPKHILETTGNGLLKSVLLRIKQTIKKQLLNDYRQWANSNVRPKIIGNTQGLSVIKG